MRSLFLSLILISTAVAQPAMLLWDSDGVPIRQGHNIEWNAASCEGNAGEVITAWSDTRNQWRQIFAQKIDDQGNELWAEDGLLLFEGNAHQQSPVIEKDGSGGAFICWVDFRSDTMGDLYAQHVNSAGELLFNATTAQLCTAAHAQTAADICYDEVGGFYICWEDRRNGTADLYAIRLLTGGDNAPGFAADGIPVVTELPQSLQPPHHHRVYAGQVG